MARLPTLVQPGLPHHITQRGIRVNGPLLMTVTYPLHLDLLAQAAKQAAYRNLAISRDAIPFADHRGALGKDGL
jgi:hypothetical protein